MFVEREEYPCVHCTARLPSALALISHFATEHGIHLATPPSPPLQVSDKERERELIEKIEKEWTVGRERERDSYRRREGHRQTNRQTASQIYIYIYLQI